MRYQKVSICGLVQIDDSALLNVLGEILAELRGPLVVEPSAAWEAIFTAALNASEITLDAETLDALENITVTVDTTGGPVEITGEVTLANDGAIDVNITNTPLDVNVTNFAELLNSTLNVTLNGEEVNVTLNPDQIAELIADDDTDDDLRPVNVECFHWKDGENSGTFIGWANANEDGTFNSYTTLSGDVPPATATVTCEDKPTTIQCWKDKFVEGGLDNTFTSFTHTNQTFDVTFDNGDTASFVIASATGWTDQVSQMSTGLSTVMPWAQTVEPFCNVQPNGCGGLPFPSVPLNKMVARYVGFRVCPGSKVPVSVVYNSDQTTKPIQLVIQYVETPTLYLNRCIDCEGNETWTHKGEPYVPVCAIPCEVNFPELPLSLCSTTYREGCDNLNQTDIANFIPILRAITNCGNGPETAYLQEDADGALVDYTLVGKFVDCAAGEVVSEPPQSGRPTLLEVTCVNVDGTPTEAYPVVFISEESMSSVGRIFVDTFGNVIVGEVEDTDDCDCIAPCCDETIQNAFSVADVDKTANTKFNLDDSGFTNAYGDIGNANWTAADLAAALNTSAPNATGPTVPSNIDYSTTVWVAGPDYVYVTSGPVPATLDLVSISVSIPVSVI